MIDSQNDGKYQVDLREAVAALDGSHKLLADLADMFCEDAPEIMQQFGEAVEKGDLLEARRSAHSIKGLASTFFAKETVDLAAQLEREAAHGQLAPISKGGLDLLSEKVDSLISELRARGLTH